MLRASLLSFVVMALVCAPAAGAQTVAGSVSAASGTVTIQRAGAKFAASSGTQVDVGDRLDTGPASSVTVTLSDGSQMQLTDSSTLTIDENTLNPAGSRQSTKVSLLTGLVRSIVRVTPGTPPNYEVHTPNAVASARGTNFNVDHHTGVHEDQYKDCFEFTHVWVRDGNVHVFNPTNLNAPPVEVTSGHNVTIPCAGLLILGGGLGAAAIAAMVAGGAGAAGIGSYAAVGGFSNGSSSSPPSVPTTPTE